MIGFLLVLSMVLAALPALAQLDLLVELRYCGPPERPAYRIITITDAGVQPGIQEDS